MARGGGGVPASESASVGKREGGDGPSGVLNVREFTPDGGGAAPPLEGATEAARGGSGVVGAGETALVTDFPGDAV